MAKIPNLTSGKDIAATATGTVNHSLPYGKHCIVDVYPQQHRAILLTKDATLLADLDTQGNLKVALTALDSVTVAYANKFLVGTGQTIARKWRDAQKGIDTYYLKADTAPVRQPRKRRSARRNTPSTTVAATPAIFNAATGSVVVPTASPSPVITIAAQTPSGSAAVHPLAHIPGIVLPSGKAKVRKTGYGTGYMAINDIVVETTTVDTVNDSWAMVQDGDQGHILVTGPSGTAKSVMVAAIAEYLGIPYLKVDGSTIRTADDWAGALRQDPNTKVLGHIWSPFAQVLRTGHPCLVLVDEVNRTESQYALNALLGLLDPLGTLSVPDAATALRMPKGILMVATANIGPEFVGTLPLDPAVRRRFPFGIRTDFPSEKAETQILMDLAHITQDTADRLVRMADQQRRDRNDPVQYPSGNVISTATLVAMAKRMAKGRSPERDVVLSVLRSTFDPDDDRALSVIVDTQFPKVAPSAKAAPAASTPMGSITVERHYYSQNPYGVGCGWSFTNGTKCGKAATDGIHI
jgi:MoxR-like ATPase